MHQKQWKRMKVDILQKLQDNHECYGHAQVYQETIFGTYPPLPSTHLGYGQPNGIL
jgi:hypothetical protein